MGTQMIEGLLGKLVSQAEVARDPCHELLGCLTSELERLGIRALRFRDIFIYPNKVFFGSKVPFKHSFQCFRAPPPPGPLSFLSPARVSQTTE